MKLRNTLIILFFSVLCGTSFAQERRDMPRKIRELKKLKLIEELQLNEKQKEPFQKMYDSYLEERQELNHARKKIFKRLMLMSELGSDVPDEKIKSAIQELEITERKINEQQGKILKDIESVLTVSQVARFIVFEEHFEHRMKELMFRFRGKDDRKGPPFDFPGGMPFMEEHDKEE